MVAVVIVLAILTLLGRLLYECIRDGDGFWETIKVLLMGTTFGGLMGIVLCLFIAGPYNLMAEGTEEFTKTETYTVAQGSQVYTNSDGNVEFISVTESGTLEEVLVKGQSLTQVRDAELKPSEVAVTTTRYDQGRWVVWWGQYRETKEVRVG